MTSSQQMREKFEAFVSKCGYSTDREPRIPDCYLDDKVEEYWDVWQSAHQCGREEERAEVVARLRHDQAKFDLYNGPGMSFASAYVGELIAEFEGVSPTGEKGSNSETVWGNHDRK